MMTCNACGEKFWDDERPLGESLADFEYEVSPTNPAETLTVCSGNDRCLDWAAEQINVRGTDIARDTYREEIERAKTNARVRAGVDNHRTLKGVEGDSGASCEVLYYKGWLCKKGGLVVYELVSEDPPSEPVDLSRLDTSDEFHYADPISTPDALREAVEDPLEFFP